MNPKVARNLEDHLRAVQAVAADPSKIEAVAGALSKVALAGGRILVCGNGGSASDAQHIAGELVGRFKKERRAIAAVALNTDTAVLTCLGNDYGYDTVFARQVEALGRKGDALVAISTSGNSANVLNAAKKAKEAGLSVIGFLGGSGGRLLELCDLAFVSPSADTPRIQEMHILAAHIVCELVEDAVAAAGR